MITDPRQFLVDDTVRVFDEQMASDLVASTTVTTVGAGKYVVFSYKVPSGQCLVVAGISPYIKQRYNLGGSNPGESVRYVDPMLINDFTVFEPQVNDACPLVVDVDFAAPRVDGAAATLNNRDRQRRRGFTCVSTNPRFDSLRMAQTPLNRFLVPSDALFRIIFEVLPAAAANGLPADGTWSIDNSQADYRIDFAGAHVYGWQMSAQTYKKFEETARKSPIHF